jgi:hypothetical protein
LYDTHISRQLPLVAERIYSKPIQVNSSQPQFSEPRAKSSTSAPVPNIHYLYAMHALNHGHTEPFLRTQPSPSIDNPGNTRAKPPQGNGQIRVLAPGVIGVRNPSNLNAEASHE